MIILTNFLEEKPDEGGLNVAKNLTMGLKKRGVTVVTYEKKADHGDMHLCLNKFFLNSSLFSLLCTRREPVLYLPATSNSGASIFRTWILSLSGVTVYALYVLMHPMGALDRMLLKLSRARVIVLSAESYRAFREILGDRVTYLKTGVDLNRFVPVTEVKKKELRRKYGFPEQAKIVLHVGHLKEGRNIRRMLQISPDYHLCLVTSTWSKKREDLKLRADLEACTHVTIMDSFISRIEELYQLADVYFFPVIGSENCIDVPLSVLEAAACNLPVVTTAYGELREFVGKEGFFFLDSFDWGYLNERLGQAAAKSYDTRASVSEYDWERAVSALSML